MIKNLNNKNSITKYKEDNIVGLFEVIGRASGQGIRKEKDFCAILTPESAWPNVIYKPQFKVNNLPERISSLQKEIEKGICPHVLMTNSETSTDIIRKLEDLNIKSSSWTAMTIELNKKIEAKSINNLSIRVIDSMEQMKIWCSIVQSELMENASLNQKVFNKLLYNKDIKFYLGFIDNEAVSTTMSFTFGDSVGVYLIATLAAHRRKGIGKQMTVRALNDAKDSGCSKGVLQATELGMPVYSSIGFRNNGEIKIFNLKKTIPNTKI